MTRVDTEVDQWRRLEIYRQRYSIEDRLGTLLGLEKSMNRRRVRAAMLTRRLDDLTEQISEVRGELRAIDSELAGSHDTGALLIEEIIEQVRSEMGEAWSPNPVRGFRVWRIENNKVMGNQVHWASPTLVSRCLRDIPGEDLPHPVSKCGPPACGIYAVKELDMFRGELVHGALDRSVVGVIGMTGKVIEHEDGYRSQAATALAIVAKDQNLRLVTEEAAEIESFFDDPFGAMARVGTAFERDDRTARDFLVSMQTKEQEWT